MAARAIWKGELKIGSAQVPVKLYSGVSDKTVRFHILDGRHHTRVKQHMVDADTGEEVDHRSAPARACAQGGQARGEGIPRRHPRLDQGRPPDRQARRPRDRPRAQEAELTPGYPLPVVVGSRKPLRRRAA